MPYHTIHYHTLPYTTPYHTTIPLHYIHTYLYVCDYVCALLHPSLQLKKAKTIPPCSSGDIPMPGGCKDWFHAKDCKALSAGCSRLSGGPYVGTFIAENPYCNPKLPQPPRPPQLPQPGWLKKFAMAKRAQDAASRGAWHRGPALSPESWPENSETGIFDLRADLIRVSTKVTDKLKSNKFC